MTVTVMVGSLVLGIGIHEIAHIVWYVGTVGEVPVCASGLPIRFTGKILMICTDGVSSAGLMLVGPVAGGVFGLGMMHVSTRLDHGPGRLGLFSGGVVFWLYNALYALGWIHVVYLRDGEVVLLGDGVSALYHAGYWAQFPGLLLLAAGVLSLGRLVEFRG